MEKQQIRLLLLLLFFTLIGCDNPNEEPFYRKFLANDLPAAGELKIPKIIHQVWGIWDNTPPPQRYLEWSQLIKDHHPDWEYKMWDRHSAETFIEAFYPDLIELWNSYDRPIKKADMIRPLLMDHFGGVYFDMDFFSVRNLSPLLLGADLVMAEQDEVREFTIANAFIASIPKHPFWKLIIDEMPKRKDSDVLVATGPVLFTDMTDLYLKKSGSNGFRILNKKFIYPFPWYDKNSAAAQACVTEPIRCMTIFPDAFAVTAWGGSWVGK